MIHPGTPVHERLCFEKCLLDRDNPAATEDKTVEIAPAK